MTRMERFLHTLAAVLRLPPAQGRHRWVPDDEQTTVIPRIDVTPYAARQETR